MSRTCYRFFGCFLTLQENWLNKMAAQGYRLAAAGKLAYQFESCECGKYQYRMEYIGEKSRQDAEDYKHFLEDCGYGVFYKNCNLSVSLLKLRWRPWADKGGRLASNDTTYNRELLIVEKENDGSAFELHTTNEDRQSYYRKLRKPWLFLFLAFAAAGTVMQYWVWLAAALAALVPVTICQRTLEKLKKEGRSREDG